MGNVPSSKCKTCNREFKAMPNIFLRIVIPGLNFLPLNAREYTNLINNKREIIDRGIGNTHFNNKYFVYDNGEAYLPDCECEECKWNLMCRECFWAPKIKSDRRNAEEEERRKQAEEKKRQETERIRQQHERHRQEVIKKRIEMARHREEELAREKLQDSQAAHRELLEKQITEELIKENRSCSRKQKNVEVQSKVHMQSFKTYVSDFEEQSEQELFMYENNIDDENLDINRLIESLSSGNLMEELQETQLSLRFALSKISFYFLEQMMNETNLSMEDLELFQELYFQIFDSAFEDELEDLVQSLGELKIKLKDSETILEDANSLMILLAAQNTENNSSVQNWAISCVVYFATSRWDETCAEIIGDIIRNFIWDISDIEQLSEQTKLVELNLKLFAKELTNCLMYRKSLQELFSIFSSLTTTESMTDLLHKKFSNIKFAMTLNENNKNFEQLQNELIIKNEIPVNVVNHAIRIAKQVLQEFENKKKPYPYLKLENLGTFTRKFKYSTSFSNLSEQEFKSDLIKIIKAVSDKKYTPHPNQVLTVVLLFLLKIEFSTDGNRGILEMATGEGKSCVIAMFAAFVALHNIRVDIITSSPVLSIRDCEEWKPVFQELGINCSENISSNEEELKAKLYKNHIVYGTISSFAADILQEMFQMKQTRADRGFEMAIVDEVDMLFLDQGVQYTYLSQMATGLSFLEPLLINIWNLTSQYTPVTIHENSMFCGPAIPLFELLSEILISSDKLISASDLMKAAEKANILENGSSENYEKSKGSIKPVNPSITEENTMIILALIEKVYNIQFEIYKYSNGEITQLVAVNEEAINYQSIMIHSPGFACMVLPKTFIEKFKDTVLQQIDFKNTLEQSEPNLNENQKIILPKFLENYVNNQISVFIESALKANSMQQYRHYLAAESDICPVDYESSGVVERNKKWGDGLQQFIEIKEGQKMTSLSMVTNFISNVAFFERYIKHGSLIGITGTLGGSAEKRFLTSTYQFKLWTIPTNKIKKVYEKAATICDDKESWKEKILKQLKKYADLKRATLVICEDINFVKELKEYFSISPLNSNLNIKIYTRNDIPKEYETVKQRLEGGDVLLATNLAGRGTDIKISEQVNNHGGLAVLVTFLTRNRRVELQAFGRTGRVGAPGSCEVILDKSRLPLGWQNYSITKIRELVNERENKVFERMTNNDLKQVRSKELLFEIYCRKLNNLYKELKLTKNEYEIKALIDSLNEWWGYWLQNKETSIGNQNLCIELENELEIARCFIFNNTSPTDNPFHLIKFANEVAEKLPIKAIQMYTQAIKMANLWTFPAYYQRALTRLKAENGAYSAIVEAIKDLEEADKRIDFIINNIYQMQCSLQISMSVSKHSSQDSELETSLPVFQQISTRQQHFSAFKKNIEDSLKVLRECTPGESVSIENVGIFDLIPTRTEYQREEALRLYSLGLNDTFSVKKRPKFCWSAMAIVLLGLAEIVGGTLLCVFSIGALATVGAGLIAEGVSDIISGIEGIIRGEFSITQWAVMKAISIAISIACAGFKVLMKAGMHIARASKAALVEGTKEAIQIAGKSGWRAASKAGLNMAAKELKTGFQLAAGEFSAAIAAFQQLTSVVTVAQEGMTWVARENLKNAGKLIVKEVAQQSIMKVVEIAESKIVENLMQSLQDKVKSEFKTRCKKEFDNKNLDFYKLFIKITNHNFMILSHNEELSEAFLIIKLRNELKQIYSDIAENSVDVLVKENTTLKKIIDICRQINGHLISDSTANNVLEKIMQTTVILNTLQEIASLDHIFNQNFLKFSQGYFKEKNVNCAEHANKNCLNENQIKLIIEDVLEEIAIKYSEAFKTIFENGISGEILRSTNNHLGKALRNKFQFDHTIQKLKQGAKLNSIALGLPVCDEVQTKRKSTKTQEYAEKLLDENTQGSILEIRVQAEKLGKRIEIYEMDQSGKMRTRLPVVPSTCKIDDSPLKLLYHPPSKDNPHGHYEALVGKTSIPCTGQKASCVFEAVERARNPNLSNHEVLQNTKAVRKECAREISANPKYAKLVQQRLELNDNFSHRGGLSTNMEQNEDDAEIEVAKRINHGGICSVLKKEYSLLHKVEAHHVPPMSCYKDMAKKRLELPCVSVTYEDHQIKMRKHGTTGSNSTSKQYRKEIAGLVQSKNFVGAIIHNFEVDFEANGLGKKYEKGFNEMIDAHCKLGNLKTEQGEYIKKLISTKNQNYERIRINLLNQAAGP